jgi:O-antigen ligase
MSPLIAAVVYCIGICGLFYLERGGLGRVSRVLWLPTISLLLDGTRPISFWMGMQWNNYTPQVKAEVNPLDTIFTFALMVAGIMLLYPRLAAVAMLLRRNAAVILYVVYCGISVSWSDYPGLAFKRWVRLLGTFVTVFLILTDKDPWRAMRWVLTRVGLLIIPTSILLIKYFPQMSTYFDQWTGERFVSGMSMDKNMLGMTCLVTGLAILVQFLSVWKERGRRGRGRRLIAYGVVLLGALWLFSSANSQTSSACFYIGSLMLVAMSFLKLARRPVAEHMMALTLILAAFSVLFLHIGEGTTLQHLGRSTTLSGRTEIWSGLLAFAGNPLFGTGFDSFWMGDRLRRIWGVGGMLGGINEAHNGYLEMYLNLGWVGIALLAALITTGYRNISIALLRDPEPGRFRLVFFVVTIVYCFTEVGFRTGSYIWIIFLFVVCAVPNSRIHKESPTRNGNKFRKFDFEVGDQAELQSV